MQVTRKNLRTTFHVVGQFQRKVTKQSIYGIGVKVIEVVVVAVVVGTVAVVAVVVDIVVVIRVVVEGIAVAVAGGVVIRVKVAVEVVGIRLDRVVVPCLAVIITG